MRITVFPMRFAQEHAARYCSWQMQRLVIRIDTSAGTSDVLHDGNNARSLCRDSRRYRARNVGAEGLRLLTKYQRNRQPCAAVMSARAVGTSESALGRPASPHREMPGTIRADEWIPGQRYDLLINLRYINPRVKNAFLYCYEDNSHVR